MLNNINTRTKGEIQNKSLAICGVYVCVRVIHLCVVCVSVDLYFKCIESGGHILTNEPYANLL